MLMVTVVCISIVTGLFLSTKERVEANEGLFLRKTILQAANIPYPDDFREVTALYEASVTEVSDGQLYYRVAQPDGSFTYVVPIEGAGLWGPISLLVGFTESLDELTGIGIFSQNETPGLGARIEEEWYRMQFVGKRGPFVLVDEGMADAPDEIDAITGATRTSLAMRDIINEAVTLGPAIVRGSSMISKRMKKTFLTPLGKENPVFVQILGICSTLAVTNKLENTVVMTLGVLFTTMFSSFTLSLIRKFIPSRIRMIVETMVIATFVIIVDIVLKAYIPDVWKQLGPYVGLIITNCIIMGRAEAFALNNTPGLSLIDGLASGIGYSYVLLIIAFFRELLGTGTSGVFRSLVTGG